MVLDGSPSVEVLKVVLVVDKDTGEKKFAWKFGNQNINLYMLVGVLDTIKNDLLQKIHANSSSGEQHG